ncbi:hypothetical protein Ocin01_17330, partial [Orchesella cincta]
EIPSGYHALAWSRGLYLGEVRVLGDGCQPSNWAVKGYGQYGRAEKGRKSCKAGAQGHKYNCCPGKSGGKGRGSKKKKTRGGGGAGGGFVNYNQFRQAVTSSCYPALPQVRNNTGTSTTTPDSKEKYLRSRNLLWL